MRYRILDGPAMQMAKEARPYRLGSAVAERERRWFQSGIAPRAFFPAGVVSGLH